MRSVLIRMTIAGRPAADVYETLADFARYPQFSPAVRSVEITDVQDARSVSRWEVAFRAGVLKWVEEDRFDATGLNIKFRQIEGDVALFDGTWTCSDTADGTLISFAARLDMGIPTLADALEPIAVRTLIDNTIAIVSGLFGGVSVESAEGSPLAGGAESGLAEIVRT
jgi:ribosome-associated toxin RatA of RatAB toxin-antitoxin module